MSSDPGGNQSERLFFALWPPPDLAQELATTAQQCSDHNNGRAVPGERIHLTLAFLGEVAAPGRDAIEQLATQLAWSPFELTLDRLGHWSRRQLIWAGSRKPPPAVFQLVESLRAGLARLGYRVDGQAFKPHLSLVRRARRRPQVNLAPHHWSVADFALVRSRLTGAGPDYRVLGHWPATVGKPG